jgi:hypothetical protein
MSRGFMKDTRFNPRDFRHTQEDQTMADASRKNHLHLLDTH